MPGHCNKCWNACWYEWIRIKTSEARWLFFSHFWPLLKRLVFLRHLEQWQNQATITKLCMFKFLISTNLNEPLSSLPCGVIQSAETEPVSETSSDGLLRIQSRSAVGLMRNKTSKLALKPEVAWNRVGCEIVKIYIILIWTNVKISNSLKQCLSPDS